LLSIVSFYLPPWSIFILLSVVKVVYKHTFKTSIVETVILPLKLYKTLFFLLLL